MSSELMKRLAPKVARFFPVIPGETLEAYCRRAMVMNADQRAMMAAYVVAASREIRAERQVKKDAWIASARLQFSPGPRRPCEICSRYVSLTEAHHIVPLALQYDAGAVEPIQEHRWLCPTHHVAEHVIIDALLRNAYPNLEGMPIEERDALNFGADRGRFVDLLTKLPHWNRVLK